MKLSFPLPPLLQGAILGFMATVLFNWHLNRWQFWVWFIGWALILNLSENARKDDV